MFNLLEYLLDFECLSKFLMFDLLERWLLLMQYRDLEFIVATKREEMMFLQWLKNEIVLVFKEAEYWHCFRREAQIPQTADM